MRKSIPLILLMLLVMLLTACAKEAEETDPSDTVESYMKALVEGNEDNLRSLSCPAREEESLMRADSFQSVDPRLEGLSCQRSGESGDDAIVTCEGSIVATYDGEEREVALTSYLVTEIDGEWKWCGETAASE